MAADFKSAVSTDFTTQAERGPYGPVTPNNGDAGMFETDLIAVRRSKRETPQRVQNH
jgi:hypothetical protein